MKESILQNLKKYNHNFQLEGKNKIRVKLALNLDVLIEVSEDKLKFESQLVAWNPLSGIMRTSLKRFIKSLFFWSLAIVILYFAIASMIFDVNVLLYNVAILIAAYGYTIIVSLYYFITYESFKTKVMLWLK
jgi:hypothetical protein